MGIHGERWGALLCQTWETSGWARKLVRRRSLRNAATWSKRWRNSKASFFNWIEYLIDFERYLFFQFPFFRRAFRYIPANKLCGLQYYLLPGIWQEIWVWQRRVYLAGGSNKDISSTRGLTFSAGDILLTKLTILWFVKNVQMFYILVYFFGLTDLQLIPMVWQIKL